MILQKEKTPTETHSEKAEAMFILQSNSRIIYKFKT